MIVLKMILESYLKQNIKIFQSFFIQLKQCKLERKVFSISIGSNIQALKNKHLFYIYKDIEEVDDFVSFVKLY